MKKTVVWLLVLSLVTAMAWIVVRPHAGPGYPTAAVTAVLESVTAAAGAEIVEKRTVSGSLRSQARDFASLQIGIDRSLGRPVFDSFAQFRIELSTSKVGPARPFRDRDRANPDQAGFRDHRLRRRPQGSTSEGVSGDPLRNRHALIPAGSS